MSDQPGLKFPPSLFYSDEFDTWAREESDGQLTVGISALGIALSGDIYMCRPRPVGSDIEAGRSIAVVELAKSIVSVKSPVSGCVTRVNPLLEEQPEQVHRDPYGAGWLARLAPGKWADERGALLHGDAVAPVMLRRLQLALGGGGTPGAGGPGRD